MATEATAKAGEVGPSIALEPNNASAIPLLLGELTELINGLSPNDQARRLQAVAKARDLTQSLQTPREMMQRHLWTQHATVSLITVGMECGLFGYLATEGGSPKTVDQIANATGVERSLLRRILRHLTAVGHLVSTSPDMFAPTNFARALTLPTIYGGYPIQNQIVNPAWDKFPAYLAKYNYHPPSTSSPTDPCYTQQAQEVLTPVQFAHNLPPEQNFFEYAYSLPGVAVNFSNHMAGCRQGVAKWTDEGFYPLQERLIDGFSSGSEEEPEDKDDAVFLVDIGGSTGHDLVSLVDAHHPNLPGRLILQDLPEVVAGADKALLDEKRIEVMGYDFFTEQPVKEARAYYIHGVLHDWPDDKVVEILSGVKAAMKPGYSRLLVNETVTPREGANWALTSLDINMFLFAGAKERTEEDFLELIENRTGLKILKTWSVVNGQESLVECELPV
ncbi:S-adenosyl-L-methionine-dependent methyltransferase [Podospora australis]|uniref:S-adenosyl-L-methionine-dependent methyltransferase n=1 Tax=Podospora australis TaxID=1536484 RepID=A0AAN7ADC9_9PEZI|nr:S-adenosyl-L-methionine-dependent methyltransferase [Podospora australis]